eukprot:604303-Alexandrium_andersonii.AAC.1
MGRDSVLPRALRPLPRGSRLCAAAGPSANPLDRHARLHRQPGMPLLQPRGQLHLQLLIADLGDHGLGETKEDDALLEGLLVALLRRDGVEPVLDAI